MEQCRASFSNPSRWKCNACAAAEPSTSTRQAITSQGGIQRAMLPCFSFITIKTCLAGAPFGATPFSSHLQNVSFTRHGPVKNRVDEETEKESRYQAGHHDGPQAQQRSFARGRAYIHAFKAQFVDVGNQDHTGFY